jgi:hypothetical protein
MAVGILDRLSGIHFNHACKLMELVAALVAEHVGFAKGGFRRRSRLLSVKEGLMRKIIALVILAVVA